MTLPHADRFSWQKSSYSGGTGGNCVEVGKAPEYVGIRDTKNRDLGHITVTPAAWRAFVRSVAR